MTYSMLVKVKETLPHSALGEETNWDKTYWTKRDKQTAPPFFWFAFLILTAVPWANVTGEVIVCVGNWSCLCSQVGKQGKGL